ncbi:helix-turn-helix domain-containing protein [Marinibacterium sp. SX1]|uniref:helix-turn-helix domain-containing protein n=1 Tax=Marinibacterium sp. SX1 TaxID=3388424 RepID=UPI003D169C68
MITREYREGPGADTPRLFTSTRHFNFSGKDGRLVHRILDDGARGFRMVAVRSSGHRASFVEDARLAVTIPLRGSARVRVSGREIVVLPGQMLSLSPSERDSVLSPEPDGGSYESYTVMAPSGWARQPESEEMCLRARPSGHALKAFLDFAFLHLRDSGRAGSLSFMLAEALLEDTLLQVLAQPGQQAEHRADARMKQIVDRACEVMAARFSHPLSILDIARSVGVGERTLQKAFRACRGNTPREVLAEMRLSAMRRDLLSGRPGVSVTTAALNAGLCHLGRSSAAYKARYGEAPSVTLRRNSAG